MTDRLNAKDEVLAAFEAEYRAKVAGPEEPECLLDWRSCYPQFEDHISEKAGAVMDEHVRMRGHPVAPEAGIAREPVGDDERDDVLCAFLEAGDPTPALLREWRRRHPELNDELIQAARESAESLYLHAPMPEEPGPTPEEIARALERARGVKAAIKAGTYVPREHERHPPDLTVAPGRELRESRRRCLSIARRAWAGRRGKQGMER